MLLDQSEMLVLNSFKNLIGENVTLQMLDSGFFAIHGIRPEVIDLFPPKSFTLSYAIKDQWSKQNISVSRRSKSSPHLIPITTRNAETKSANTIVKYSFEAIYSSSKSMTRLLKSEINTISLNQRQMQRLLMNLIQFITTPEEFITTPEEFITNGNGTPDDDKSKRRLDETVDDPFLDVKAESLKCHMSNSAIMVMYSKGRRDKTNVNKGTTVLELYAHIKLLSESICFAFLRENEH